MRTSGCFLVLLLLLTGACNAGESDSANKNIAGMDAATDSLPDSGHKLIIYQVFTRLFGNTKSINKTYGTLSENGVGKFSDFTPQALSAIKQLGVSHIWYTGVIEHATMTDYSDFGIIRDDADVVKGRAGSPYAIKDYYDVDPDLADSVPNRMAEFEALVARTHEAGLKVLIDFVPNHVARQYLSDAKPQGVVDFGANDDTSVAFDPQNNFYYLPGERFQVPKQYDPLGKIQHPTEDQYFEEIPAKATGNDVFSATPSVNDWFETVKLNYGVDYQNDRKKYFDPIPDTWLKMRDILLYWAGKKVDGFRCDMAEMVPVEFWQWVIPAVKKEYPDIIFIAEIYNPSAYARYFEQGRFDYQYDKVGTYDALRKMMEGTPNAEEVITIRKQMDSIDHKMLRFLENHDEQRIASEAFAGNPQAGLAGMVVSATLGQGPVMLYFGQEVGEPGAGVEGFQKDDGRTTIFDYWGVPEHQKWMNNGAFDGGQLSTEQRKLRQHYAKLLHFVKSEKAITHGDFTPIRPITIAPGPARNAVMVYWRHTGEEGVWVVANFYHKPVTLTVPTTRMAGYGKVWVELFSNASLQASGQPYTLEIPPMTGQIWHLIE